jgi:hypothetical protein
MRHVAEGIPVDGIGVWVVRENVVFNAIVA